jgi:hypothetical protein
MRGKVAAVTGEIETNLDRAVVSLDTFSQTFDTDVNKTLEAGNNFSKAFGITFSESIELMKTGALSVGPFQDELLDKFREYPKLLADAGFSAEDFIKIATTEVREGIYDDKLTDSIKESNISLKEFTQTQRDAIALNLGNETADTFFDLINNQGDTTKDIILELNKIMEENQLSQQEMAIITADIFKGAGEDAGGLEEIINAVTLAIGTDIDDLVDKQDDLVAATERVWTAQDRLSTQQNLLSNLIGDTGLGLDGMWKNIKAFGLGVLNGLIARFGSLVSAIKAAIELDPSLFKLPTQILLEANIASGLAKKRDLERKQRDEDRAERERKQQEADRKNHKDVEIRAKEREKAEKKRQQERDKRAKEEQKRREKES